ncbi:MAG TPA: NifU family protein [Phycisphaerae bacterium]|nr:NifU family protein [Phycisphaerae bacterium]
MREQVAGVIDARIRPAIQQDGGDIELVDVNEQGIVSVRLRGACSGCPGARMTLKMGVERLLKQVCPQVTEVVCVQP